MARTTASERGVFDWCPATWVQLACLFLNHSFLDNAFELWEFLEGFPLSHVIQRQEYQQVNWIRGSPTFDWSMYVLTEVVFRTSNAFLRKITHLVCLSSSPAIAQARSSIKFVLLLMNEVRALSLASP